MNLSLNLNKIALLRNSRGSDSPSLESYANESIKLGVDGIMTDKPTLLKEVLIKNELWY